MQDPVLAIDLEWKPEFKKGFQTPVAVIQLASSQVAVIIKTSWMQAGGKAKRQLAPSLENLIRQEWHFAPSSDRCCSCRRD